MTALELAAKAMRHGAVFSYGVSGAMVVHGLQQLPTPLRRAVQTRLGDVFSVIHEHSVPQDYTASDVADAARKIALTARRSAMRA
jgi:hypothetical protein